MVGIEEIIRMNRKSDDDESNEEIQLNEKISLDQLINNIPNNKIYRIAIILALGNAADAVEIMCVGFIMTNMSDNNEMTQSQKEFLTASVFIGMLFGGLLCGYMSDRIGRRPTLLTCLIVNTVFGFLSAVAPNVSWLIFFRIIAGLGIGGSVPAVFSLGAELFPTATRGKLLSVIASFWMVGAIFTAAVAWIMLGDTLSGVKIVPSTGWRSFAAISAIPALIAFILTRIYIPESPRYDMAKGDNDKACSTLSILLGCPIDPSLVVSKSTKRSEKGMTLSPMMSSNKDKYDDIEPIEDKLSSSIVASFQTLFKPNHLWKTLVLSVIWFTLCFGSYGISAWISELFEDVGLSNAYGDTFIFALANLPGNIVSIIFVESLGRRRLLSYGMGLAAISLIGFIIDPTQASVVVLSASLFNAFSVVGWNSLDCMSVEYFPTSSRTSAMGFLAACGRFGAISAQFVNGSLENNVTALLLVTSGCMAIGGLCSWLLPQDCTGALDE
jgi:MFS family permease